MKKTTYSKDELKMPEEGFGRSKGAAMTHHSHFGIILGLLILVLALILIGLYLWAMQIEKEPIAPMEDSTSTRPTAAQNKEPESNNARADTQALDTTSSSDELDAIDADIKSTNLDTLDSDIPAINAELQSNTTS